MKVSSLCGHVSTSCEGRGNRNSMGNQNSVRFPEFFLLLLVGRVRTEQWCGNLEMSTTGCSAGLNSRQQNDPVIGQRFPFFGDDSIMCQKAHGTCNASAQQNMRWNCDRKLADNVCCFNRHYAEHSGYWKTTEFRQYALGSTGEIIFYDSVTTKSLFIAPRGRSMQDFIKETSSHGWPSFRDPEVVWENVRCLKSGEAVSVDGTHLGHNIPDHQGNRYCINLVSIAGQPSTEARIAWCRSHTLSLLSSALND